MPLVIKLKLAVVLLCCSAHTREATQARAGTELQNVRASVLARHHCLSAVHAFKIAARLSLAGAQAISGRSCGSALKARGVWRSSVHGVRAAANMAYVPTVQLEQYEQQLEDKVSSVRKRFDGWSVPEVQVRDARCNLQRVATITSGATHARTLPSAPSGDHSTLTSGRRLCTREQNGTDCTWRMALPAIASCCSAFVRRPKLHFWRRASTRLIAVAARQDLCRLSGLSLQANITHLRRRAGLLESSAVLQVPLRVRNLARGRGNQVCHV